MNRTEHLTERLIERLTFNGHSYVVRDEELKGFLIRVGKRTKAYAIQAELWRRGEGADKPEKNEAAHEVIRQLEGGRRLPIAPTYLSPTQLSQLIGVTTQYLTKLRREGKGPKWRKLGPSSQSPIRYHIEDIHAWVKSYNGGGGNV